MRWTRGKRISPSERREIGKVSKEEEARTAEKMKTILNKYVQEMKAKGLPGEEALKFCQDYIKTHP